MKNYTLKDITAFNAGIQFTIGRGKRMYEYTANVTDPRALFMHTIVVLYDFRAQQYIAVDLSRDKRADEIIHIIY